ncbi:rhodanese-like domain-containing protein [Sedimenticola sp.]|uniref:rhodanese-like domain-containing protein n=1 Tax=Sedimenticola sp. TaxID=1940285 RepID=UPI003D14D2CC
MEKCFNTRVKEAMAAVPSVTAHQAMQLKEECRDLLFLDPRNQYDITATTGIIPGAISLPLDQLESARDERLSDRQQTIITACQGGPMGALAAHTLKQQGFNHVYYIDGGTQGWLDAGYPTER